MNSFLRALPRVLLWILCGTALSAVFFLVTAPPRGTGIALAPAPSPAPILVQGEGAVAQPGLYPLSRESRVADAVQVAGGLSPEADSGRVNLAARLKDGEKLVIPFLGAPAAELAAGTAAAETTAGQAEVSRAGEISTSDSESKTGAENNGVLQPINLNTATLEELDSLPGIGPTRAADIIAYR